MVAPCFGRCRFRDHFIVLVVFAGCHYGRVMDTPTHSPGFANRDDDVPREGLPAWPTPEQFGAASDREDAQVAAGAMWPDVDIVSELRNRAEALEAEIAKRRT